MTSSPLALLTDAQWRRLSVKEIARQHAMQPASVRQWRSDNHKPKGPRSPGSGRPTGFDLTKIDWTLTNRQNAARVGCTESYIGYLRRKHEAEDFA